MKARFVCCASVLVVLLVRAPVGAQGPLTLYDDFSAKFIDPTKWASNQSCGNVSLECVREIQSGSLRFADRSYGVTSADTGGRFDGSFINFAHPAAITAIQSVVKVANVEVSACAGNPTVSQTQARLFGSFFNVGTPTPGSFLNDVTASINIERRSDSTDRKNTLHVSGLIVVCSVADCSAGSRAERFNMGTIGKGQATTLLVDYDPAQDIFIFSREPLGDSPGNQALHGLCPAPPCAQAGNPIKFLGVNNFVASCTGTPRPVAYMEAFFDDVMVNPSALP